MSDRRYAASQRRGRVHKTASCDQCDWREDSWPVKPITVQMHARRHTERTGHVVHLVTSCGTYITPRETA